MAIYLAMYLFPVAVALLPFGGDKTVQRLAWLGVFVLYTVLIGLRHEVGGDWFTYLDSYRAFIGERQPELDEVLELTDPAYSLLNWAMESLGLGIYGVNLVCAAIFMAGVIVFSRRQPSPWIAFAITVPYLVVVVAHGLTRQSAAIGLLLLALTALLDRRFWLFTALVLLGGAFHKTVLPFLLLPLFGTQLGALAAVLVIGLTVAAAFVVVPNALSLLSYLDSNFESQGGLARTLLTAAAGVAFFCFWTRWPKLFPDRRLWAWFSIAAIASPFLVDMASTAVDRMALYIAPLQVVVWTRVPELIEDPHVRAIFLFLVVVTYGAILLVWLNFSPYTQFWLPYRNLLLEP